MTEKARWLHIDKKGKGYINGNKNFPIESPTHTTKGWNIGELEHAFLEGCVKYDLEQPDDDKLHRICLNAGKDLLESITSNEEESEGETTDENEPDDFDYTRTRFLRSLAEYPKSTREAFRDHIGMKISEVPEWVIAHIQDKQVKRACVKEEKTEYFLHLIPKWTDILIDGIPTYMIETYNPLTKLVKYEIEFQNSRLEKTLFELEELKDINENLLKTHLVLKQRTISETMAALINAYKDAGQVTSKVEIEQEGFFFIKDRLVASKVEIVSISREQATDAANLILEMKKQFYWKPVDTQRFAHTLKLAVQAPFDYARRQKNYALDSGFLPRPDLAGSSDSGKTLGWAGMFLTMYRKQPVEPYFIGEGSMNTPARFIEKTSITSFPIIMDEVDFLTTQRDEESKRILSLIKNQAAMTHPRDTVNQQGKANKKPSFSYPIFTHNSAAIEEDGAAKRFSTFIFTQSDVKKKAEQGVYSEYMKEHSEIFAYIGDFAIAHIMKQPDLLKKDWLSIGKQILKALFDFGSTEYPSWLDDYIENTSIEDISEKRRMQIRTIIVDEINRIWAQNRYELIPRDDNGVVIGILTLKDKVRILLEKNMISTCAVHHEKGVCMFSSIIKLLNDKGVERVSMQQLADLTGFTYDGVWFGKTRKVVYCSLDQLDKFLTLEQSTDGSTQETIVGQNTLQ